MLCGISPSYNHYEELLGEGDSFQQCMQRADQKLYRDKELRKKRGRSTVCL